MMIPVRKVEQYWLWIVLASVMALLVSFVLALTMGAVPIALSDLMAMARGQAAAQTQLIVLDIRLPRILLALCVGALLAICGAATQGLFRNPLADPSLIGVSAGAAAGAGAVIVLVDQAQWSWTGLSFVSLGAFGGGLVTVLLVYRLATGPLGTSVTTMLLAGIGATFLAGSIASVFEFMADNAMLKRISLWRMGGLDGADYPRLALAALCLCVVSMILMRCNKALNALLLGESEARHLGIDVDSIKRRVVICVAAGTGITVAFAGTIAFVGLVVPHLVRFVIGPNHRYLLPVSAMVGAVLLINADTFARRLLAPAELPLGLVTAMIGAPFFLFLLQARHRRGWA